MRSLFRLCLLAAVLITPLAAIGQVRDSDDRFIGETQRFANGSGLVIAASMQRR